MERETDREHELFEESKLMALHFVQGVWACEWCLDKKAGVCKGRQLVGFEECWRCIRQNH